jgi:flagellar hook protein FlgE
MSLFGSLQTSVSGMSAQSNLLSAIGDNIANSNTVGYKNASAQFETMLGLSTGSIYDSGSVQTTIRYGITQQGTQLSTTIPTDMEIQGNGFFVVQSPSGETAMTRAGDFVPNATGTLVNSAGYTLMGYPINSTTGVAGTTLQVVSTSSSGMQANATTSGTLSANFPSTATVVTANDPISTNSSSTVYTDKSSITTYDSVGNAVVLDLYMTKTADASAGGASTWTVAAYNHADASATGGFPYTASASEPGGALLGSGTYTFDSTTGTLDASSANSLSVTMPGADGSTTAGNIVSFDLSKTTQLAAAFNVTTATANGNAPGSLSSVSIGSDGTLTSIYSNGAKVPSYKIPLANVVSPDNLTPINGNAYQISTTSGGMTIGAAGSSGYGSIAGSSLEQSTVDIATELTNMIASQRAYEANSKVLQTSSDLLSLINKLQT